MCLVRSVNGGSAVCEGGKQFSDRNRRVGEWCLQHFFLRNHLFAINE